MLFIIIRSKTPKSAAKAVEVADATKRCVKSRASICVRLIRYTFRARHRAGMDQDTGLWQYVVDDPPETSGPKVIDLNDKARCIALLPYLTHVLTTQLQRQEMDTPIDHLGLFVQDRPARSQPITTSISSLCADSRSAHTRARSPPAQRLGWIKSEPRGPGRVPGRRE